MSNPTEQPTSAPSEPVWTEQYAAAHKALYTAAERIGLAAGRDPANWTGRGKHKQFNPPQAQRDVIAAMKQLAAFEITPEQAMATLHEYDILKARTA